MENSKPKPKIEVSLIIPVYNEVTNIGRVIAEARALPSDERYSLEILVVDGGSSDGTTHAAVEAGARVVQQRGRGYGAACYTGFEEAPTAALLIYLDGDYSDPPGAIPALLEPLLSGRADLVLGSRTLGQFERGALPRHAVLGNRLIVGLINRLYKARYSDLPSFKALRREKLAGFGMREMTYGWTTELLVKAARSGCRTVEVPINYRRRGGDQSKVSGTLKGTVKATYFLFKATLGYVGWKPD